MSESNEIDSNCKILIIEIVLNYAYVFVGKGKLK